MLYATQTLYGVPVDQQEANWSTATLRDVHTWLQRGARFTGVAWKNDEFGVVVTALNRVRKALGGKVTHRALGLGRTLTFDKITGSGTSWADESENKIRLNFGFGSADEDDVNTTIHEVGHIVDGNAYPGLGYWSVSSSVWTDAAGWQLAGEHWVLTPAGRAGAPTGRAWKDPLEDFAETFACYVEMHPANLPGSRGYPHREYTPDLARRNALTTALNTFR